MKSDVQRRVGDVGNVALLLSTVLTSAMLIYRLPSEAYFDEGWLRNGFCIRNSEEMWGNSHALSFYLDVCFAAAILGVYTKYQHRLSAVGQAQAFGSIFATLGHGMGHLHYGMEPGGMDLRFDSQRIPESLGNTLVMMFTYMSIFGGTMPLASKQTVISTAVVVSAVHNILDIPPTLMFVYAQAAIYTSSAIHMLSLHKQHKESMTYMAYGLLQLPVVAVGILEATQCESFLKALGGHAAYDGMIGVVILINIALAAHGDDGKLEEQKKLS